MITRTHTLPLITAIALLVSHGACESTPKTTKTPKTTTGDVPGEHAAQSDAGPARPNASPARAPANLAASKAEQRGTARVIRLPQPLVQMPEGPNKQLVLVQCAMCHTPQYITMQPPLSKDTWTAEITKMRTTYSGPIPEEQVPQILDYLLAVNGAK